jgi:hypothetical protein
MTAKQIGRWPADRQNLLEEDMWKLLQQRNITILIRVKDSEGEGYLCPLTLKQTDMCSTPLNTAPFALDVVRTLFVRFAYPAMIPMGDRDAHDFQVTVEDIFGNLSLTEFKPGTCIEVQDRFVKTGTDPDLGRVWKPIIIVYDKVG